MINLVSKGQCFAIIKLISKVAKHRQKRLFVLRNLIKRKVTSTKDVFVSEWQNIRDEAYPNWEINDWTIGDSFIYKLNKLSDKYEDEILGQQKLF